MPRSFIDSEPKVINKILGENQTSNLLQIATSNQNKLKEFQRLIPHKTIEGVNLKIDEVQSLDAFKVISEKAKTAFEKNSFNPILVEDTSFELLGLENRPGPFVAYFMEDPQMRRLIATHWLKGKDRRALVRVCLGIHDGIETYIFEGKVGGLIADEPRGTNGFTFDDIFIPEGQVKGKSLTFAEMSSEEKDKYSMRRLAVEEFLKQEKTIKLGKYVFQLPEPFHAEMDRVQKDKLQNKKAINFAYTLEALQGSKTNKEFKAENYNPLIEENNKYYERYRLSNESASIGIIVTDIDKANSRLNKNGSPILWQMGPERRELAIAQRTEFFIKNSDPKIFKLISDMEKGRGVPEKNNKRHATIETLLRIDYKDTPFHARAIKEIGYKKLAATKEVSRSKSSQYGLFNKIGKYPRLMFGVGSLPAVSCWRDVILTTIIGHMPIFIARNNIYASNIKERIKLILQVKEKLKGLGFSKEELHIFERNIGIAIGSNPIEDIKEAEIYYKEAGIKLFRIYTINSDPRFVETAENLRNKLGDDIEIFAGQLVDKQQGLELMTRANVDGIIFGHGGGRQCTSATNGMALSTVEEIYSLITDERFNNITLLVEGGVSRSVGGLIVLGIDGILYNQQLTRGTIETGGIFLQHANGNYGQPYHGSASAPTMIIEAANEVLKNKRLTYSGRTRVPEGKKGFTIYEEKANSMAFWIDEFKHQAARTLADIGVENLSELRTFIKSYDKELLRIVSTEAAQTSKAWGSI